MKILMVIPYFVPATSYGGPVKVSFDLSRQLVRRGHEVTVATTDVFDDTSRIRILDEVIDGVSVIRFRNLSNAVAKRLNGYTPVMFIPWLRRHLGEFDVVYCHDFFTLQNIAVSFFCRRRGVPFLVQPHGCLSPVRQKARFSTLKNGFISLFGHVLRNACRIIALTAEERASVLAIDPALASKTVVVPNGLDLGEFSSVPAIDLHARYEIAGDHKIVAFIGRLSYIKGIDIALEVLAAIKDTASFTFLVIGPDEGERERLKLLARELGIGERVVFAGMLDGAEKLRTIKSCDLFLFTSRDEGLPMSVLEVAALGVPQVISQECNVPELATYGAGYVHPVADIDGLAASVGKVLTDAGERRRLGENALKMVAEVFAIEKTVGTIDGLLAACERKR